MISLKKDYEQTVKLISKQVQLPTTSQHCSGLSTLCITVHMLYTCTHMHTPFEWPLAIFQVILVALLIHFSLNV